MRLISTVQSKNGENPGSTGASPHEAKESTRNDRQTDHHRRRRFACLVRCGCLGRRGPARRKAPLHILNSSTLPMIYGSMVAFTQEDYDRVRADGEAILSEAKAVAQSAVPNGAESDVTTELVEEAITPVVIPAPSRRR